jgi:hypothetical protein
MAALGIAWDLQGVPKRIYEEARVLKARRAVRKIPSVIETAPLTFGLAEEAD